MNNALQTTQGAAIAPIDFEELELVASKLAGSFLMPKHLKGRPEDVFATLMMGRELGLGYTTAINSVYVVHGKPALYSAAMVALIKASPSCAYWRVVEATDSSATVETLRNGTPEPERVTFTQADAKRAGYTSNDKYRTNPAEMLTHKAGAILARRVYPDVLRGMHTAEELQLDPGFAGSAHVHSNTPKTSSSTSIGGRVSLTAAPSQPEPEPIEAEPVEAEVVDEGSADEPDEDTKYRNGFRKAASQCLDEHQLSKVQDYIDGAPVPSMRALAGSIKGVPTHEKGKAILDAAKEWREAEGVE